MVKNRLVPRFKVGLFNQSLNAYVKVFLTTEILHLYQLVFFSKFCRDMCVSQL